MAKKICYLCGYTDYITLEGLDYLQNRIAENLQDGLLLYLTDGFLPGDFLTACLENDLSGAMGRASTQTWDYLYNVIFFLYNYAPSYSWGSRENVKKWVEKGGIKGGIK